MIGACHKARTQFPKRFNIEVCCRNNAAHVDHHRVEVQVRNDGERASAEEQKTQRMIVVYNRAGKVVEAPVTTQLADGMAAGQVRPAPPQRLAAPRHEHLFALLGEVPRGLPMPALPLVSRADINALLNEKILNRPTFY